MGPLLEGSPQKIAIKIAINYFFDKNARRKKRTRNTAKYVGEISAGVGILTLLAEAVFNKCTRCRSVS